MYVTSGHLGTYLNFDYICLFRIIIYAYHTEGIYRAKKLLLMSQIEKKLNEKNYFNKTLGKLHLNLLKLAIKIDNHFLFRAYP